MAEIAAIIIAGLAMWLVELLKRKGMDKFYVPPLAFVLAGLVSVLWYFVFDPSVPWRQALKDGLTLGAVAGGLYGFGQTFINKKPGGET